MSQAFAQFFRMARRFLVGDPPPPRKAKDAAVLRAWEDYRGKHVAIDKGWESGIKRSDIFYVVNPNFKIEVTHPDTGEVLTTYYKNTFKIWAETPHKAWTECSIEDDAVNLNRIPAEGNIAIFQYNMDRYYENPRRTTTSPRFE